ncbi:hypothetical protein [Nesterenkonia ebinurensis]|uniref:hypothetical protein n=1 Tax=Nesterenkonia ebinurensis TaxID=2608252 RepID=UPI00123D5A47|nr:hypothetical protein [Nesterenkonia ebinurensis]
MSAASTTSTTIQIITASLQDDGAHSSNQLAPKVKAGQLLRVRRGVYVEATSWIRAQPWTRHRIAVAATAAASDPVFCRETALLLHNVPLIRVPTAVTARTLQAGGSRTVKPPPLTGPLNVNQFRRLYRQRFPGEPDVHPSRLLNIPTKLLHPPLSEGISRKQSLGQLRSGTVAPAETHTTPFPEVTVPGLGTYRVEPLELAVVDTVSRMPFEDTVVALDWIKAQPTLDLEPWLVYLSNGRLRTRWTNAWEFASPLSESPGESRSRALIHRMGFSAPSLQVPISSDRGQVRVDFCWEGDKVIGEFDGRTKYVDEQMLNGRDPGEVLFAEKLREDALRRAGWTVVRWTWDDLNNPQRLAKYLAAAGISLRQ